MALRVNQSGTWRNITIQCVNQAGTWRRVVDGCINQSGTWRCYGMTAPTAALSASPTTVIRSGGEGQTSTLTWSSTRAQSVASSNFGATTTSGNCVVGPAATTTYNITMRNAFADSNTATATVTVDAPTVGTAFGGGRLICRAGGINWIAALSTSEVRRSWYARGDSNVRAQQVSGCTGWFVPTITQLQNPGYVCRARWDTFTLGPYWSSTEINGGWARGVRFTDGVAACTLKTDILNIRSFRCVTY
jgi:hypothetical protein